MESETVGARIRKLREQAEMSQEEVANALEIGRPHLSRIETGKQVDISTHELLKASRLFGVSADFLLTGIESKDSRTATDLNLSQKAIDFMANDSFIGKRISWLLEKCPNAIERVFEYLSSSSFDEMRINFIDEEQFPMKTYIYRNSDYSHRTIEAVESSILMFELSEIRKAVLKEKADDNQIL